MTDYTELLLQVSDVMRKHNRVVYRNINSILPLPMTDEEAVKAIRGIVIPKDECVFTRKELESWLYEIAFNNCNNNLGNACEEIISRLDGFERFIADRRSEI